MTPFPGNVFRDIIEEFPGKIKELEAMRLWQRFLYDRDEKALQALLQYNGEDVVNLYHLEARLANMMVP
jgi:uncharacterized protein YprB with RNaseH-like and TPR domain